MTRKVSVAIELFLETLTDDERSAALSREILTTAVGRRPGEEERISIERMFTSEAK